MMELPDFSSPYWFVAVVLAFFIIIIGRYFVVAGFFFLIFYTWFPDKWINRKINSKPYTNNQLKKEVVWSTFTALIFSLAGSVTVVLWQKGLTRVYERVDEFGWPYLPFSLLLLMVVHETYYYWIHRWMHVPSIFKKVHKVHHNSKITSPFTAFSFHPLEGFLQAIFLPIVLMILPIHYYVIIVQLTIMTITSVINHLDIEIYPKNFHKHFIGKWMIGASHHSLHHKQFKYNYGLYFTFWDKIKKTESPLYNHLFESKTAHSGRKLEQRK